MVRIILYLTFVFDNILTKPNVLKYLDDNESSHYADFYNYYISNILFQDRNISFEIKLYMKRFIVLQ